MEVVLLHHQLDGNSEPDQSEILLNSTGIFW